MTSDGWENHRREPQEHGPHAAEREQRPDREPLLERVQSDPQDDAAGEQVERVLLELGRVVQRGGTEHEQRERVRRDGCPHHARRQLREHEERGHAREHRQQAQDPLAVAEPQHQALGADQESRRRRLSHVRQRLQDRVERDVDEIDRERGLVVPERASVQVTEQPRQHAQQQQSRHDGGPRPPRPVLRDHDHRARLYFRMQTSARTPSRQLIFLPSA
jgi:hypothetical protein